MCMKCSVGLWNWLRSLVVVRYLKTDVGECMTLPVWSTMWFSMISGTVITISSLMLRGPFACTIIGHDFILCHDNLNC